MNILILISKSDNSSQQRDSFSQLLLSLLPTPIYKYHSSKDMTYFNALIFNEDLLKDGKEDQAQKNVCYLSENLVFTALFNWYRSTYLLNV